MSVHSSEFSHPPEGDRGATDPETLAHRATEAIQTYLATPLQRHARWQDALDAPFKSLRAYPNPTEAQIREAVRAYETVCAEVAKEVESAGQEMSPPLPSPELAAAEFPDLSFDQPLPFTRSPFFPSPTPHRVVWRVPVATYVFFPSDFRPDGRNAFTLATNGREPANAPFFGGVSGFKQNGTLTLHNAINSASGPATMRIWAGVGVTVIPQSERGWLRVKTHVAWGGTGSMDLPPGTNRPASVRADNIFSIRMMSMSTNLSGTQRRTEQDVKTDILSQGWTGAGFRGLGGQGSFYYTKDRVELLFPFDQAAGQTRMYEIWVMGEDLAICGADLSAGAISSIDINMTCRVPFIRVEELVDVVMFI